jgi:hypothetical protein
MVKSNHFQSLHGMFPGNGGTCYRATAIVHGQLHIFEHRHGFEWTYHLMGPGHAFLYQRRCIHSGDILAVKVDLAAGGADSAGNQAEKRCLACAIGTNETADLFFRDIKAHVLQRRHAPKVLGQRLDFQNLHFFS